VTLILAYRGFVLWDGVRLAQRQQPTRLRFYQDGWAYAGGFVLLCIVEVALVWEVGRVWVWPLPVYSAGMVDTLLPGDVVLVDRLGIRVRPLAYGDVVAFRADWPDSPLWVLRTVGLPGDEITMRGDRVWRNGELLDEPYLKQEAGSTADLASFGPQRVPPGHVFLLGDNRGACNDSRIIGFVSLADVLGRVPVIAWSNDHHSEGFSMAGHNLPEHVGPVRWQRIGLRLALR
jgi:signal peptidase I